MPLQRPHHQHHHDHEHHSSSTLSSRPLWQRILLTLGLMSTAVFVLNLAGPSSLPKQQSQSSTTTTATTRDDLHRHPQYASLTQGYNDSGIPCITYWTLGCPLLKGPYVPPVWEASEQQPTKASSSTATKPPTIGLLRYITTPLPDYHDADEMLRNLRVLLEFEQEESHDNGNEELGDYAGIKILSTAKYGVGTMPSVDRGMAPI